MAVYKPDKVTDKILTYFRKRRFIETRDEEEDSEQEGEESDLSSLIAEIAATSSNKNCYSFNPVVKDIEQAERQFSLLYAWVVSKGEEHANYEIYPMLMPLLCHLYLDSLSLHSSALCTNFMQKLAPPLLKENWYSFVQEIIRVQTLDDFSSTPLGFFRERKCQIKLTPNAISNLRNFLAEKNLYILIPPLHLWFDVKILTEDRLNDEQDSNSDEESELSSNKYRDGFEVTFIDKHMEELVREIQIKRLQPTPAPPLLLFTAHRTQGVVCARVSSECDLAVTGDKRSEIKIWGLGETKLTPSLHPFYFDSVPLSLYTEPYDDSQSQNERQVWSLRGHCETVYDLTFVDSSDKLISVSFDTTMRLWDLSKFSCSVVYRGHSSPIWGVAYCSVNKFAATGSQDRTARLWSLDRTFPIRIMAGHLEDVTSVAFHPNGTYTATGSCDRTVKLWSVTDGNLLRTFGGPPIQGPVYTVAFSPNGYYLASGGEDESIWIWDLQSGGLIFELVCGSPKITCVEWSHDGGTISGAAQNGYIYLWSLDTEKACSGKSELKKYYTKCSTLLSLQFTVKNALVSVGLSDLHRTNQT